PPPRTPRLPLVDAARRTLVLLGTDEAIRWLSTTGPLRAFLQRLPRHLPRCPGGLVAPWIEYLLTSRFELVSRFLEGIREPFLVDTAPLRARLVDAFRGAPVPNRGV